MTDNTGKRFLSQANGYLANIRSLEWRAYLGMSLLGYLQGIGSMSPLRYDLYSFGKYIITVMLYLAFSFAINNCYDFEGDKLGDNISKNPVASGLISERGGKIQSWIIAFMGIGLSIVWFDWNSAVIYMGMMLLSGAYSTPPFRLKSVPYLDMTSHGLFFGSLIILYGISVTRGFSGDALILLGSIYVFSLILELRNHIEDYKEDLASNVKTTVVKIGVNRSVSLLYALLLIHFSLLFWISWIMGEAAVVSLMVGLPAMVVLLYLRKADRSQYLKSVDVISSIIYVSFVLSGLI